MKVNLVSYTSNAMEALESAIGNCYDSKVTEKTIAHVIKSGHHSVLEFIDFHFHIEDVSRALLAQLTRHRLASYAVRSQRYCTEEGFDYVVPYTIQFNDDDAYDVYFEAMQHIEYAYEKLLEIGVPAEDARYVLPNATHTKIDVKMNLRSLMNFMNLRMCRKAQWEINDLAHKMRREVLHVCPDFEEILVPKCVPVGFCNESKGCGFIDSWEV